MATRAITRPIAAVRRELDTELLRAATAPPPDPTAWFGFLCDRCDAEFKVQGFIARHCVTCIAALANHNIIGAEYIGEASGA